MLFKLNKFVVNGVKNINKPIELTFTNLTINEDIFNNKSNIKAIYGANGSGKTAIITAMYIYKRLILFSNNLYNDYLSNFILDCINKNQKEMSLEVVFTVKLNNKITCIKHYINIGTINNEPIILKETISILKNKTINNNNFNDLIIIENGNIIELFGKQKELFTKKIVLKTLNLLSKKSICSFDLFEDDKLTKNELILNNTITIINNFLLNTIVQLTFDDTHTNIIGEKMNLEQSTIDAINNLNSNSLNKYYLQNTKIFLMINNEDIVNINDFNDYQIKIKKLTDFIRLFKSNLVDITIDKKIIGDKYKCRKIFKYSDYEIDLEFESTGIKKLVKLFNAIRACANGLIVFIDEFDANLHDIYFTKLIEFFKDDGKGQLCFTTHNLEPINILKTVKHSLDFLSNDSRIYTWTKNGNSSPLTTYLNGLMPYSPFNIEPFDFDILFEDEDLNEAAYFCCRNKC